MLGQCWLQVSSISRSRPAPTRCNTSPPPVQSPPTPARIATGPSAPAHKQRIAGLEVAICGDIRHSRVARSNIWALTKLGARVRLAAPRTLLAPGLAELGVPGAVAVHDRIEPALEGADVVMMLRIQKERMSGALFPDTR